MGKNKVDNESLSFEEFILEGFHHKDLGVIQSGLPLMGDILKHIHLVLKKKDDDLVQIWKACLKAHELNKNYALMSSMQEFDFGDFHKCNVAIFVLGDAFNIDLRTSLFFQPWGNDGRVFKANIMFNFNVEIFHHFVALHTFWR